MKPNTDEQSMLVTREELARRWSCTSRHIDNLVTRGEIATTRIGRLVRFSPDEIERYIAEQTKATEHAK
ncbi:MAG TPA: helix-turn-helix domain-containing protein [Humisphaera sp.]|jgi:excisionase family DNA binding protein|nr:helix-turn-helix domain-containing protein [Humisphaera sp.]